MGLFGPDAIRSLSCSVAWKSISVKQSGILLLLLALCFIFIGSIRRCQVAADWTNPLLRRLPPPHCHERAARDAEQLRSSHDVERTEPNVEDKSRPSFNGGTRTTTPVGAQKSGEYFGCPPCGVPVGLTGWPQVLSRHRTDGVFGSVFELTVGEVRRLRFSVCVNAQLVCPRFF